MSFKRGESVLSFFVAHLEGARDKSHRASHGYDLRDGCFFEVIGRGEQLFDSVFFLLSGALISMLRSLFNLNMNLIIQTIVFFQCFCC